jgi:hypothetical protein
MLQDVILSVILRNKLDMNMILILNGNQDRALWIYRPDFFRFCFLGLGKERSLQKKGGCMRRVAFSHFYAAARIKRVKIKLDKKSSTIMLALTHSMQQSPSWEANCFLPSQEIARIFLQPEGSLQHSQVLVTCPCPEPARFGPCPHIPHPEDTS